MNLGMKDMNFTFLSNFEHPSLIYKREFKNGGVLGIYHQVHSKKAEWVEDEVSIN